MNKRQTQTIENVVDRISKPNMGCSHCLIPKEEQEAIDLLQQRGHHVVSDLYVRTWIRAPLVLVTSSQAQDQVAALELSRP